jgi:hypothetical protein
MIFDDDVKLFGLMRRYSDSEEVEELKRQVISYVRTQIHDVNAEIQEFQTASATQDSGPQVFEVSACWLDCVFNSNAYGADGVAGRPNVGDAQAPENGPTGQAAAERRAAAEHHSQPDHVCLGR